MAWHLAEPVTDQTTKSDYWRTVALGTPSENMRGGYFRQAINIDGAGQSKTVIADYLLTGGEIVSRITQYQSSLQLVRLIRYCLEELIYSNMDQSEKAQNVVVLPQGVLKEDQD